MPRVSTNRFRASLGDDPKVAKKEEISVRTMRCLCTTESTDCWPHLMMWRTAAATQGLLRLRLTGLQLQQHSAADGQHALQRPSLPSVLGLSLTPWPPQGSDSMVLRAGGCCLRVVTSTGHTVMHRDLLVTQKSRMRMHCSGRVA